MNPPSPDDKPTLSLIRRVLCAHQPPTAPLERLLPALTSSADLDVQLYAFIAIIVRDFIYPWYTKLTTDHDFVDELIAVIAHCTRSIEERLRKVDLQVLLLDELPAILENHIRDYRQTLARHTTSLAPHLTPLQILHNLQPHPALSNSPETEKLYLNLLSSKILAFLLPVEDLESTCERTLVREILSSIILWNAVDTISEPFMVYEIITKLLNSLNPPTTTLTAPTPHFFDRLITILTATLSTAHTVLSSLPSLLLHQINPPHTPPPPTKKKPKKPVLKTSLFTFISTYLRLHTFQPWTHGIFLLFSTPLVTRNTLVGAFVDDILSSSFRSMIYNPELLTDIIRTARHTLFPNNSQPPPAARPPPASEQQRIRKRTEEAIVNAVPERVWGLLFGDDEGAQRKEWLQEKVRKEYLDLWAEKEMNKYAVYRVLDLVVGRVMPELLVEEGGL